MILRSIVTVLGYIALGGCNNQIVIDNVALLKEGPDYLLGSETACPKLENVFYVTEQQILSPDFPQIMRPFDLVKHYDDENRFAMFKASSLVEGAVTFKYLTKSKQNVVEASFPPLGDLSQGRYEVHCVGDAIIGVEVSVWSHAGESLVYERAWYIIRKLPKKLKITSYRYRTVSGLLPFHTTSDDTSVMIFDEAL
jgi:hypothetical protein